ncbi:hypothetical protein tb265_10450 [Gemmatimonadetes bacterium T265]|nr:hypothetical protein tb265_10450 [Gemmatimonadetes bacterium T265]
MRLLPFATRLAALPAVTGAVTAAAQPADHAAFVVTLGRDTVAAEQSTRRGNVVEGDVMTRQPEVRVTHYVVTLDDRGRPTSVETRTRAADGAPVPRMPLGATGTFRNDSVRYDVTFADSVARHGLAAPAGALPFINYSYAVYEIATRRLRAAGGSADTVRLVAPGMRQAAALALAVAGDTATLDYFGDPVRMRLDRDGRVLGVDGTRTTNKVVVTRVPSVDLAALTRAFAARPAMGVSSPLDSVRAAIGAAQVAVVYSRPSVRGRTVWGGQLVPYGTWWRTGANAATAFRTTADLTVGGVRVPAGSYTLFTLPTAAGAQLIVSKKTGEWGTEYDATQDLARIPLTVASLTSPVEQFTIAVEPRGADAGVLRMRWADRELSASIAVAR